jgi:hypothetical protein
MTTTTSEATPGDKREVYDLGWTEGDQGIWADATGKTYQADAAADDWGLPDAPVVLIEAQWRREELIAVGLTSCNPYDGELCDPCFMNEDCAQAEDWELDAVDYVMLDQIPVGATVQGPAGRLWNHRSKADTLARLWRA